MDPLTRTRWGPFMVGVVASLVIWGLTQTPVVSGGWIDLVWLALILVALGAASAVVGGLAHAAWGSALAGLAGLLVAWVVINLRMGYVGTAWFVPFLLVALLFLGVPYLAGYWLAWVVQRSRSNRKAITSRA